MVEVGLFYNVCRADFVCAGDAAGRFLCIPSVSYLWTATSVEKTYLAATEAYADSTTFTAGPLERITLRQTLPRVRAYIHTRVRHELSAKAPCWQVSLAAAVQSCAQSRRAQLSRSLTPAEISPLNVPHSIQVINSLSGAGSLEWYGPEANSSLKLGSLKSTSPRAVGSFGVTPVLEAGTHMTR